MDAVLNTDEAKYRIEDYLMFCLSNAESLEYLKEKELKLYDCVLAFVLRQAKRIRPILLMLVYQGYAEKDNEQIIHAGVTVELMHTFALIHDDIMDHTEKRDVTPSLYHAINELSGEGGHGGESMAMLLGDLLYNIALDEFQKVGTDDATKLAGVQLLLDAALKTGRGQLMEQVEASRNIAGIVLSQSLQIYDLKTAHYTFCLPLKLGALLAGVDADEMEKLDQVGIQLGRAYQIIDDIHDFPDDIGNSHSYLSALLWKHADQSERKELRGMFSSPIDSANDRKRLEDLHIKHGTLGLARIDARDIAKQALSDMAELKMNRAVRDDLIGYISCLMKMDD